MLDVLEYPCQNVKIRRLLRLLVLPVKKLNKIKTIAEAAADEDKSDFKLPKFIYDGFQYVLEQLEETDKNPYNKGKQSILRRIMYDDNGQKSMIYLHQMALLCTEVGV